MRIIFSWIALREPEVLGSNPSRLMTNKMNTLKGTSKRKMKKTRKKQLYKSKKNKMIGGVCGGIGEYFNIDPTLIRLVWAISIFWMGFGFLAYLIALIIIPERK